MFILNKGKKDELKPTFRIFLKKISVQKHTNTEVFLPTANTEPQPLHQKKN